VHLGCGVCELQASNAGDAITILLENQISRSALASIKHLAELTPKELVHNADGDCALCEVMEPA
jgi:hypothetical protein